MQLDRRHFLTSLGLAAAATLAACGSSQPAPSDSGSASGVVTEPAPAHKPAILVVSFGTSYASSRYCTIGAIEAAIRFAERDGHTLVIISADHETGATILSRANPEDGFAAGVFASKGHTPMMVPLFAYGPRSGEFGCIQENSDVANKILQIFGVKK